MKSYWTFIYKIKCISVVMTVSQRSSNNPVEHRKRITSLLLFGEKSGPNVYSKASHLFILDFLDNQKTESTDRGSLKEKKKTNLYL